MGLFFYHSANTQSSLVVCDEPVIFLGEGVLLMVLFSQLLKPVSLKQG